MVNDSLAPQFKYVFEKSILVDVHTTAMVPTWSNGNLGGEGVLKRLHRYMMVESLVSVMERCKN